MHGEPDPFLHHPELRGEIVDPLQSLFRSFTTADLAERTRALGLAPWWHSDEEREALRAAALAQHGDGDLWIFAYGSLMWDPAIRFAEVCRAHVPDYARRFILKSKFGARGTPEAPGLMAALDRGPGCDGLAFRIPRERVEAETEILWRREQIGPAYKATFVEADLAECSVPALTFVADHEAELIDASLTHDEQVHLLATGKGLVGSSLDYLRNIQKKFSVLGIHDAEIEALLRDAEAYLAAL